MPSAGYFDLQVNGYAGVDFNADDLTPEALNRACQRMQDDGVDGALATIITADLELMTARLNRLVKWREQDALVRNVIAGLHIEGPFLNRETGYVGAHPPQCVTPADVDTMKRLVESTEGLVRIVTLAPENDEGFRTTRWLADQKIAISGGHSNASRETLMEAIDAGLTMFTHLGNGCPVTLPRHDGIIQRVLSLADRLWVMFIADGAHVPFFALKNYLKVVGLERAIVVTDAIAAAGMGPGRFTIGGVDAIVGDDLVPRAAHSPEQFAGSGLTMPRAAENLKQHLGLNDNQVQQLCSVNPRRAISA